MKKILFLLVLGLLFIIPANAEWKVSSSKDEMTGEQSFYAISPTVSSTKKMSSPYTGTKACFAVGYDGKKWWTYFSFSSAPNIFNKETKDGYSIIETRIKWDEKVEDITLTQTWGSKYLFFRSEEAIETISKITKSKSVLLELNWYNQEKVYFRFPLKGSDKAVKTLDSKFKNN